METIQELLNSDKGRQLISGISKETDQPVDKTTQVISMAMPLLMAAMTRNVKKESGNGLLNALDNKHDGSILDNLGELFQGGVEDRVKIDGLGILGHVLGGSQNNVAGTLSKKTGLDVNSVMQILQVAAPILLGFLGKQKRKQQVNSPGGLEGMLGQLMGGSDAAGAQQSVLESLLDGDGDGSVLDDVAGMVLGGKKQGGLGGVLGGFFGK
jgi:hypothetical protein